MKQEQKSNPSPGRLWRRLRRVNFQLGENRKQDACGTLRQPKVTQALVACGAASGG